MCNLKGFLCLQDCVNSVITTLEHSHHPKEKPQLLNAAVPHQPGNRFFSLQLSTAGVSHRLAQPQSTAFRLEVLACLELHQTRLLSQYESSTSPGARVRVSRGSSTMSPALVRDVNGPESVVVGRDEGASSLKSQGSTRNDLALGGWFHFSGLVALIPIFFPGCQEQHTHEGLRTIPHTH